MLNAIDRDRINQGIKKTGFNPGHGQLVLGMGGAGIRLAEELGAVLGSLTGQKPRLAALDTDQSRSGTEGSFFLLRGEVPPGMSSPGMSPLTAPGTGVAGDRRLSHLWMMEELDAITCWLTPLVNQEGPLDIWLTAGMGGGTGSGCLLSMAYLVRHLTADKKDVTLRCCLAEPGFPAGWNHLLTEQLEQNSRRSFQELAYCVDLPASDQVDRQLDSRPLLDGCWLLPLSGSWKPVKGSSVAIKELLARTDEG